MPEFRATRRLALIAVAALALAAPAAAATGTWEFGAQGTLTSFAPYSITVGHTSCFRDAQSPGRFGMRIGDGARIVCRNGLLISVKPLDREGTFTLLGSERITTLTRTRLDRCALTQDSPGLVGFRVGESVTTVCTRVGGRKVLSAIAPGADPYVGVIVAPRSSARAGTRRVARGTQTGTVGRIRELGKFVTVGELRCSVGPTTPSLFRFYVGERVTMVCDAGAVVRMRH